MSNFARKMERREKQAATKGYLKDLGYEADGRFADLHKDLDELGAGKPNRASRRQAERDLTKFARIGAEVERQKL